MIDRRSLDHLRATIRDYMVEKITAFELDDALNRLARSSQDRTLNFVSTFAGILNDVLESPRMNCWSACVPADTAGRSLIMGPG